MDGVLSTVSAVWGKRKRKKGREFAGIKFARNPRGSLGPPVRCSGDREDESGERVGKGEEAIHLILRQRRKKKEKEKEREGERGEPGFFFASAEQQNLAR